VFFGRLAGPAKRFLWLRGSGLLQNGLIAGGGSCDCCRGGRLRFLCPSQGRRLIRRFRVKVSSDRLPRSFARCGIVVGLLPFCCISLTARSRCPSTSKNHFPDKYGSRLPSTSRPAPARFCNASRKAFRGCLIVLLIEEGFTHPEIREGRFG